MGASPSVNHSAIITNGQIILGVGESGSLGAQYYDGYLGLPNNSIEFEGTVHLPDAAMMGAEGGPFAYSIQASSEGWGIGVLIPNSQNISYDSIYATAQSGYYENLDIINFTATNGGNTAYSKVIDNTHTIQIEHLFYPSSQSVYTMECDITITNIGNQTWSDTIYRRVQSWFSHYANLTMNGWSNDPSHLSSLNGTVSPKGGGDPDPNPFTKLVSGTSGGWPLMQKCPTNENFEGCISQNMAFDFNFGELEPDKFISFKMFYGRVPEYEYNKTYEGYREYESVTQTLNDIDAQVYGIARPSLIIKGHSFRNESIIVNGTVPASFIAFSGITNCKQLNDYGVDPCYCFSTTDECCHANTFFDRSCVWYQEKDESECQRNINNNNCLPPTGSPVPSALITNDLNTTIKVITVIIGIFNETLSPDIVANTTSSFIMDILSDQFMESNVNYSGEADIIMLIITITNFVETTFNISKFRNDIQAKLADSYSPGSVSIIEVHINSEVDTTLNPSEQPHNDNSSINLIAIIIVGGVIIVIIAALLYWKYRKDKHESRKITNSITELSTRVKGKK